MGQYVTLEVWAVIVTAPCILSWIFGEMYGAAQERKFIAIEFSGAASAPEDHTDSRERGAQMVERGVDHGSSDGLNPTVADQREHAHRRAALGEIPCLAELNAEAQRIRRNAEVWSDPELTDRLARYSRKAGAGSIEVLTQYQSSIEELTDLSGTDRRSPPPLPMPQEHLGAETATRPAFAARLRGLGKASS